MSKFNDQTCSVVLNKIFINITYHTLFITGFWTMEAILLDLSVVQNESGFGLSEEEKLCPYTKG